jgi:hypothetical protein
MGMLDVKLDTSKFEQWAQELSERGFKNAIRRAVDQSARAARKVAIKVIAADIGVSASKFRDATPKVQTTTAGSLSARWVISKARISILNVSGASVSRAGGLHASTHRLGGGGSSHLDVSKAFLVTTASGGRFVAVRKGRERTPLKSLWAETPSTAMGQESAPAQVAWKRSADAELSQRLGREVQRQFYSEKLSASTPDVGD